MHGFKHKLTIAFMAFLCLGIHHRVQADEKRPNILFLMADDWSSPHAGALGDNIVKTPTFDRLAAEGVLFENAFASAPSCTPSRFAIAAGRCHLQLQGGANLGGSLQADTKVYHDMLAADGYHTGYMRKGGAPSNHLHRKRDPFGRKYKNFDAFLTERKDGAPFCFWFGSTDPHRPYEKGIGEKSGMDSTKVNVPGGLPNTDIVRKDMCDYYWEIQRFDRESGELLAKLEEMGELGNTIVVMTGDNGMPFPRCKSTLYDMGTHVPLAVRWGDKVKGGRVVSDFVMLYELTPMFLQAAGIAVPEEMTSNSVMPLLLSDGDGQIDPLRTFAITALERHSYKVPSRAIRTKDFLYVRKYNPSEWPNGKNEWPSDERDFSYNIDPSPSKVELKAHKDDPAYRIFYDMAFTHAAEEELYDLRKDPGQVVNLAKIPEYAEIKERLARQMTKRLEQVGDPRMNGEEAIFYEDDKLRQEAPKNTQALEEENKKTKQQ